MILACARAVATDEAFSRNRPVRARWLTPRAEKARSTETTSTVQILMRKTVRVGSQGRGSTRRSGRLRNGQPPEYTAMAFSSRLLRLSTRRGSFSLTALPGANLLLFPDMHDGGRMVCYSYVNLKRSAENRVEGRADEFLLEQDKVRGEFRSSCPFSATTERRFSAVAPRVSSARLARR